jgi:hypothetical protein
MMVVFSGFSKEKSGLYISGSLGYGSSASSEALNYNSTLDYNTGNTIRQEGIYGSFGSGVKFNGNLGFLVSDNFGAELGLTYLFGNKYNAKTIIRSTSTVYATLTNELSADGIIITPAMKIQTSSQSLNPYMKFGLVIGIISVAGTNVFISGTTSETYELTFTNDLSFGYSASAGIDYQISNDISFFGELSLISLSVNPSKLESSSGGKTTTTYYKTSWDETDINTDTAQPFPFSSIGLNVGIKLNL